jgi:hypothetical protein
MSIISLPDGWKRFGGGRRWRTAGPRYLCEVDTEDNTPNYARIPGTVAKIRRIKSFYAGRLQLGVLDGYGTGVDILVANSLAESLGTVPSPLSTAQLRGVYERATGNDPGVRLDAVIRYVAGAAKYLQRREPRYVNPLSTPGRVSVGAHHVLISTARALLPSREDAPLEQRRAETVELVCRLPAESLYAAEMAIRYLNKAYGKHLNEPPLIAATYNAGSPRPDSGNAWNLKQYGDHVDRWVAYYNTSRMV